MKTPIKPGISLLFAAACSLLSFSYAADDAKEKPAAVEGTLEEQMLGHWAPDEQSMLERFKKELPEGQDIAALLPMVQLMLGRMALDVTKEKVIMHGVGKGEKSSYKITESNPATKTVTMDVTDPQGKVSQGTATINGDKLTLTKDGQSLVFNRITKADFEKRKQAAQQPPAFPGLE